MNGYFIQMAEALKITPIGTIWKFSMEFQAGCPCLLTIERWHGRIRADGTPMLDPIEDVQGYPAVTVERRSFHEYADDHRVTALLKTVWPDSPGVMSFKLVFDAFGHHMISIQSQVLTTQKLAKLVEHFQKHKVDENQPRARVCLAKKFTGNPDDWIPGVEWGGERLGYLLHTRDGTRRHTEIKVGDWVLWIAPHLREPIESGRFENRYQMFGDPDDQGRTKCVACVANDLVVGEFQQKWPTPQPTDGVCEPVVLDLSK